MGSLLGYKVKPGDARGAYTQSLLRGAGTWATLPRDSVAETLENSYGGQYYGHADAEGFWEEHCEDKLVSIGFKRLAGWQGDSWHEKTRSLLLVYVGDYKLVAKTGEHDALLASIRSVIDMDPETLDG